MKENDSFAPSRVTANKNVMANDNKMKPMELRNPARDIRQRKRQIESQSTIGVRTPLQIPPLVPVNYPTSDGHENKQRRSTLRQSQKQLNQLKQQNDNDRRSSETQDYRLG